MKKLFLPVVALFSAAPFTHADTVSIIFDAGILRNSSGSAVVPNGSLVQILASPSGVFTAPTASSYVSGDNVLLRSFAMNSNTGIAGETLYGGYSIPVNNSEVVSSGEKIIMRFFPAVTYTGMGSAPTPLTNFGQVRSDSVEFGPAGGDGSETAWVLPAGGALVDMDYITSDDGGAYAASTAYASGKVSVASFGDINGDDKVNIADLGLLATYYGQSGTNLPGDINGDGIVNIADLGILATHYGFGATGSEPPLAQALESLSLPSVPEPTAFSLLGLAGVTLLRRRSGVTS